ncbi:hypothetical protein AB0I60_03240 [Actinosynnema sp. NPDC050436]|uniref:hypothetical protein n=1 Tax=Actinosynnema sp. NPDC050436 TaxID=3155659 RepID=UPI0033CC8A68
MTTSVVPRAPRARCCGCGSTEVVAACHHCGALMCGRDARGDGGAAKRPSSEFAGLNIEAPEAFHCPDCRHFTGHRPLRELLGGAAAAVAGVLLMFAGVGLGLVVFLLGAAVAVGAYLVGRRRDAEALRTRPPLPLPATVDSAKIRETVRGTLSLDAKGEYHTSVDPARGEFSVAMTFARADLERLALYQRKYRLSPGTGVPYHAGFAVLHGESGAVFADPESAGPVIPLTGNTGGHPFFTAADGRSGARWEVGSTYTVTPERDADHVPIWLTPALTPEQDQRTLEIEVQWSRIGPDSDPLVIDKFQPLTLYVPVSWGNVENANHRPLVGRRPDPQDPDTVVRCIEWNQVVLTEKDRAAGRLTLSVRFEERISMDDVIRGEATAFFKGTLSGLSGVEVLLPLGGRRGAGGGLGRAGTEVHATFELSLAGVRYQDLRVVPDQAKDHTRPETEDFPGIIPDHETIARLTNALSDEGYYVKRVVENPARTSGKAHVMNRYWDITGRRYDGVYPIDFSLSLTGEEQHNGDIRAHAGHSRVRLIVRATYATKAMEEQIEGEWDRLGSIIRETLRSRPAGTADAFFGDHAAPSGHTTGAHGTGGYSTGYGPAAPGYGPEPSGYGPAAPGYGQAPPSGHGRAAPRYGRAAPRYGQAASGYGPAGAGYGPAAGNRSAEPGYGPAAGNGPAGSGYGPAGSGSGHGAAGSEQVPARVVELRRQREDIERQWASGGIDEKTFRAVSAWIDAQLDVR